MVAPVQKGLLGSEGALSLRSRTLVIEAGARLVLHPAADVEAELR